MKWVRTLWWMVILFFAVLFAIQNREPTTLRFGLYPLRETMWFEISGVPLFLVILPALLLGILVAGVGDLYLRFQLKRALRQSQKTVERLEKEIQTLRNAGVDPSAHEGP